MRCPACQHENRETAKFCEECAAPQMWKCRICGGDVRAAAEFCGECRAPVSGAPSALPPKVPQEALFPNEHKGERRQLTVLFCDLASSASLGERLDPEDLHGVIRAYQERCAAVIARYGGHIAQYLGDGLLVYFGYPQAHENDAERAVRAGLDIVAALDDLNGRLRQDCGVELAVRVGIHSGPVVVGETGGPDQGRNQVLGHTMNVAARLEGVAELNTVVISDATLRLVAGVFVTLELGPQVLKGIQQPVPAYRVVQGSGVRSRLDVAAAAGLAPFLGREQEIGLLEDRFAKVQEGQGQAVILSGEEGIGKSRLVQTLRERLAERAHTWLECRASPYARDSALYPMLELHRRWLGFRPEDPPEAKLERIEAGLKGEGFDLAETVPLVAAFHAVPVPERYEQATLGPEGRRRKTWQLLTEWLLRLGRRQPVVLLMEDLHWMDPSTVKLLGQILEQIAPARVLLLLTCRLDFRPPWGVQSHVTRMRLSGLTGTQLGGLIQQVARGRDIPDIWVEEIVRRSDGVPLFAEELTKTVLESYPELSTAGSVPEPRIPETLQDSLMARLDQLGTVKELAQLGSVLGREFSYDLLLKVSPMKESELQQALAAAVREELFYQRGTPPDATYFFKHALIRDAAYESLLRSTRQRYHRRVAQTLIERMPEVVEAQPELVAHHLTEASDAGPALLYWERATRWSLDRFAHLEAIRYVSRAMDLVPQIPHAEQARARLRFELLRARAAFYGMGYGSREAGDSLERARPLAHETQSREALVQATFGLWLHHQVRAAREPALRLAEELREIVQHDPRPLDQLVAGRVLGQTAFCLGQHEQARAHYERVLNQYQPSMHERLVSSLADDSGLWSWIYAALNEWFLGFPDRSRRLSLRSIELARELNDSLGLAGALVFAAGVLDFYRRDFSQTASLAEEAIRLSSEQGFVVYEAGARLAEALAHSANGQSNRATGQMQEPLRLLAETETQFLGPHILLVISWLQFRAGNFAEAQATLEGALAMARRNLDCFNEAELLRMTGETLVELHREEPERAETWFRESLEVAKERHQRTLELRAAMCLARLWQRQCRRDEARHLLVPIYGWFTEGLDSADLKDARALLEELS